MRKPKGKLVALLAGAVVVVLVVVAGMFWKDIYCYLFLDPRLVGRWEGPITSLPLSYKPHTIYTSQRVIKFDKVGDVQSTTTRWAASRPSSQPEGLVSVGTYRIDGNSFTIVWPRDVWSEVYRVKGDTLTLLLSSGPATFSRVPDDS